MRRVRVVLCLIGVLSGCTAAVPDAGPRLVVLGIDGLDPARLAQGIRTGTLPNFAALASRSGVRRLDGPAPADTAQRWASVTTGFDAPARHGVFGPLDRDAGTYRVRPGLATAVPPRLLFGVLQLRAPGFTVRRSAQPFWQIAGARGVRSTIVGVPGTFPAQPVPNGRLLAGWPAPDLSGGEGAYHYFTSGAPPTPPPGSAGRVHALTFANRIAATTLVGPTLPLADRETSLPVTITWTPEARSVNVEVDGHVEHLQEGRWSRWVDLTFRVSPLVTMRGLTQFYLLEGGNAVRLYASPIQWHPAAPPAPLSSPISLAPALVERLGLFRTAGWPEATAALADGVLDPAAVVDDALRAFDDRAQVILNLLDARDWSLFVGVVDTLDHVAHMGHALRAPEGEDAEADLTADLAALAPFYRRADGLVGDVLGRLTPGTELVVVSTARLAPVTHEADLNAWLAAEGLLRAGPGGPAPSPAHPTAWLDAPLAAGADWAATRAYAVGNGVYVNVAGREGQGGVAPGADFARTVADVTARLKAWRDPATGGPVIAQVLATHTDGTPARTGPDLQVVLAAGYRMGWATAAGQVGTRPLAPASGGWRADHGSWGGAAVAGVLMATRPPTRDVLRLADVPATVLHYFGVPPTPGSDGRPFY